MSQISLRELFQKATETILSLKVKIPFVKRRFCDVFIPLSTQTNCLSSRKLVIVLSLSLQNKQLHFM